MKSFLDRFRRKDGEDDLSPGMDTPTDPGQTTASGVENLDSFEVAGINGVENAADEAAKPAAKNRKNHGDDIVLELGDFLHRIPHQLLKDGPHDTQAELHFDLGEIADRVARGETTIPLIDIYRRLPQVFKSEVLKSDNIDIRFPWQKVIKMIGDSAATTRGPGSAAAESLAQKLRSRQGVGSTFEAPASKTAAAPITAPGTFRPGPNSRQVSWFSRPVGPSGPGGQTLSPESLPKASANPGELTAGASASSLPMALQNSSKTGEPPVAGSAAVSGAPKSSGITPKQLDLSVTPVVDDPRLSRDEILRARDAAILQVARVRGDFERQIVLLQQERSSALEHRDKAFAELERQRKLVAEQMDKVAFDKTVLTKTTEKSAKEVEQIQAELTALKTERDQLRTELEAQTKARESAPVAESVEPGGGAGPARSQKEHKRQVDELNRRILALESNQKERTVEIGREKEARLKAERQLAAAERSLQESADHLEKVRAGAKLVAVGPEGASAQAEELLAQIHQLTAERDEALAQAAQAQSGGGAVEAHPGAAWENRALAQLEEDVENYRRRIKVLIKERDTAVAQKEALAAQPGQTAPVVEGAILAPAAGADAETVAALQMERDGLAAALREAEAKLGKVGDGAGMANPEELGTVRAELAKLREELTTARTVSDKHLAELANLRKEAAAASQENSGGHVAEWEQQLRSLTEQNELLAREKAEILARLETANQAHVSNQAAAEGAKAENGAGLARMRSENERLSKERDQATAELDKHRSEIEAVKEQRRHDQEKYEREKAAAKQSSERNTAGLRKTIETQQVVIATTTRERDELIRSRDALTADLNQARAEQKKLAGEVQAAQEEKQQAHDAHTDELAQTRARHEDAAGALTKERDSVTARAEATAAELLALRNEFTQHRTDAGQQQQKLTTEKSKLEQDLAAAKAEGQKALEDLHGEHREKLGQLDAAKTQLVGEHEQALSALGEERDRAVLDLTRQNEALTAEKVSAIAETARIRAEGEKAAAAAARELAKVIQTKDALIAQKAAENANQAESHGRERKNLEAAHAAALKQKAEEIAALSGELESLRRSAAETHENLQSTLADRVRELAASAAAHEETRGAMAALGVEKDGKLEALVKEHEGRLAELTASRQEALEALASEADHAIAAQAAEHGRKIAQLNATAQQSLRKLTEEKDAVIAQRGEVILAITAEREHKVEELAADYQRKFAELANERQRTVQELTRARDDAQREVESLNQRLTSSGSEAERTIESLTHERDAQVSEARMVAAALEEAREAQRNEAANFARDYRAVQKQRDDAQAELDQERANLQQRGAALERERLAVATSQSEARALAERELAQLRTERDSVVQQRDDLRRRISQLIQQQRQVLEEQVVEPAAPAVPAARVETPVEAHVETVSAEQMETVRYVRPRAPRVQNVIDIEGAEVVQEEDNSRRFSLPRIRPIPLTPPQIQTLG